MTLANQSFMLGLFCGVLAMLPLCLILFISAIRKQARATNVTREYPYAYKNEELPSGFSVDYLPTAGYKLLDDGESDRLL